MWGKRKDSGSAIEGDSFESLVMPHIGAAYNLAYWLTRDRSAAEDLVQETCLRAIKFFDTFRGGNSRAWLLTIVRNAYYSSLKTRRTERATVPFDENEIDFQSDMPGMPEDITGALEREETRRLVEKAVSELPHEYREVIVLRELEDLSYQEIARIVQVPLGTVMSRLSRARRLLGRRLQHLRGEPSHGMR